jgi:hypothetical protein
MKRLVKKAAALLGLPKNRASTSNTIGWTIRGHLRVAEGELTSEKKAEMERASKVLQKLVAREKWSKIDSNNRDLI